MLLLAVMVAVFVLGEVSTYMYLMCCFSLLSTVYQLTSTISNKGTHLYIHYIMLERI